LYPAVVSKTKNADKRIRIEAMPVGLSAIRRLTINELLEKLLDRGKHQPPRNGRQGKEE
jgi:hypothetical protein